MVFLDLAAGFFRRNARSEGAAEGGCGGNSAAPERSAGAKRRQSLGVFRKMGSDFFKQTPHFRKTQVFKVRLASLGDFIVRFCPHKTELAVVR